MDIAMSSANSRRIPELFSNALDQLARLVGNEFDLARAEISEKISNAGRALALIGAGALICVPALVLILFAIAATLIHRGFSEPFAYLCTGGGAALVAAVLMVLGLNRVSHGALKPRVTIDQVKRDTVAMKEMTR